MAIELNIKPEDIEALVREAIMNTDVAQSRR